MKRPRLGAGQREAQKRMLAHKLQLLIDVHELETGERVTYGSVAQFLSDEGIELGRARWSYMLSGGSHPVTDEGLLSAIARYFGVEPEYLLSASAPMPERVSAQLEFVKELRESQVQEFALRALADISPDTLRVITQAIRDARSSDT